jgi:chloride channel 3/4/5
MISIMISKWVGDAMGQDGIYSVWIAMRRYPWLPPKEYRDNGETGADIMKPLSDIIVIQDCVTTVRELKMILGTYIFHGFPVIDSHGECVGYSTRQELTGVLGEPHPALVTFLAGLPCVTERLQLGEGDNRTCTFSENRLRIAADQRVDLESTLEDSVIQLRKEVPQELVVNMFQKLASWLLVAYHSLA